jgi:hypothetical protein
VIQYWKVKVVISKISVRGANNAVVWTSIVHAKTSWDNEGKMFGSMSPVSTWRLSNIFVSYEEAFEI